MVTGPGRGQQRRSLVLCTQMRSGSWMLSDLCHQTGLLGQPEEYFRPDFRRHWSKEWGLDTKGSYAEYITSAVGLTSTANGVFGVKMHAYQMDWFLRQLKVMWGADTEAGDLAAVTRWLPNPSFVRLRRRDVARQAISYYRAVHSTVWFELDGDQPAGPGPGTAGEAQEPRWGEIRYLENGLVAQEALWTRFFARNDIEPLELVYEEMADDPAGTLRRIFDLMEVDQPATVPLRSRLKKQADEITERWHREYLLHRDSVDPVPPGPRPADQPDGDGRLRSRPRGMTSAPVVYEDRGAPPAEPSPADYTEARVTWAQLVAGLVVAGLPIAAAASLVDALPGEGAKVATETGGADWRKGLTPLPPPVL